ADESVRADDAAVPRRRFRPDRPRAIDRERGGEGDRTRARKPRLQGRAAREPAAARYRAAAPVPARSGDGPVCALPRRRRDPRALRDRASRPRDPAGALRIRRRFGDRVELRRRRPSGRAALRALGRTRSARGRASRLARRGAREAPQRRESLPRSAAARRDARAAVALQGRVGVGMRAVRHGEASRRRRLLVLAPSAGRALRRGRARAARADEGTRRLRRDAVGRLSSGAADDDSAPRRRRRAIARRRERVVSERPRSSRRVRSRDGTNPWLEARRLLVIRADNIGDVVMTGPALRAIRRALPDAELTLLASPSGAEAAPLLPWIDDVVCWRVLWQDLGRLAFDPAREHALIDAIKARAFDGALILTSFSQSPHPAACMAWLAGIPLRAGASREESTLLTHRTPFGPFERHQAERNLALVGALGFPIDDGA